MCAVSVAVCGLAPGAEAQHQAGYNYVDPWAGCDSNALYNDPTHPYSTLQEAINQCAPGDIVVANPGIYELHAPLMMASKVSVQGVGARRCIIQPAADMSTESIFWPDVITCGSSKDQKVLVDTRSWLSREFIDGFTFRGGDVQIYCNTEGDTSMAVSNCLFDLATPVCETTPSIGFLLVSVWVGQGGVRYHKKRPNILNNTFLLGYRTYTTDHEAIDTLADVAAVGIVDVNNPLCPTGDPDQTLRGVDLPSVQNNLFRTLPSQGSQIVMLGINDSDTKASSGTVFGNTNAFRGGAFGGVSPAGPFAGPLYSAIVGISPSPKVDLGTIANDPSFVGEFLASKVYATLDSYRDFRIMPGSTIIDQGQEPVGVGGDLKLTAKNATFYQRFYGVVNDPLYGYLSTDYDSFDYDMEYFGNPRIAGSHADIGFDEFHSLIVAGSYSNDDASHNRTHGPLTAAASGPSAERWLIVAPMFANATALISANGANVVPGSNPCTSTWISPAAAHDAWLVPVGALNPPYAATSPAGYATRFIDFNTPFPPTPWNGNISAVITTDLNPISGVALSYCLFDITPVGGVLIVKDIEGNADQHFELQGLIQLAGQGYYTNAQCEYR
jgi:hypothetical protein